MVRKETARAIMMNRIGPGSLRRSLEEATGRARSLGKTAAKW
jgi:hypothetical protein